MVISRFRQRFSSVRARTTLAATTVVAIALILVGVLVVTLLSQSLVGSAELRAEISARTIAGQLGAGVEPKSLDLPDDSSQLAQVVNESGKVVAAGDALKGRHTAINAEAPPNDSGNSDDDDDDDDDDSGTINSHVVFSTVTVPGFNDRYQIAAMTVMSDDDELLTIYTGVSLSAEQKAVDDVTITMWLVLPVLTAIVAVVTWLVTRRALRPVSAIRAELAEITAGDLSRRVPVSRAHDEIHDLATTTNRTLAALDSAVTQQRQFIADASHELRSPLAILRAQLDVAASHPELLDVEATLADVVRLQNLATDLLLLARLDAGERPGQVAVDVTELVREEVARRAVRDHIVVQLDVSEEDVIVTGVRAQLVRVLGNLLDNAQRFANTKVVVRLDTEQTYAVLSIIDDGPGIAIADRERVFDRFVRLDQARSREDGGAGLGLSIVKDVVCAHHGTIEVLSMSNEDNCIKISLPLHSSK